MPSLEPQTPPPAITKNLILTYHPLASPSTANKLDEDIERLAESWKLPYSIEDEDLMFDGKALSTLYEEEAAQFRRCKSKKPVNVSRGRSRYRQNTWRQSR